MTPTDAAPDEPVSIRLDVPYGDAGVDAAAGQSTLLLDVYERPSAAHDQTRAAIILVHGGGWFRGDKAKEKTLASLLVDAGYLVFVPDYRLAPDHVFPSGRDDVLAAARWAAASDYVFDRDRVAFFGGSAGGNLVVEAAIATGRPAVSWSGIFDLEEIIRTTDATDASPTTQDLNTMRSADIDQTGRDDAFLRWVILQEVGGDRTRLPAASVTRRISSSTGPVYLANSLAEFVPVSDPMALLAALASAGVAGTLQLIVGTHHAEGYLSEAIRGSLAFLTDALAPAAVHAAPMPLAPATAPATAPAPAPPTTPTAFAGIGNVFYFVDEFDAAVAWYTDRLGAGPVERAAQLAAFDVRGTRLTIHRADEFDAPGPAGAAAYWTVDDVDAFVADWTSHGAVAHRGPKTVFTGERLCQLIDPFGNLFCVRQVVRAVAPVAPAAPFEPAAPAAQSETDARA